MDTNQQLLEEVKKLNSKLDQITSQNNTLKNIFLSFSSGFFHSLGTFIGTLILIILALFFLSKINYGSLLNSWLQSFSSQIEWEKIVPQPKIIDLKDIKI